MLNYRAKWLSHWLADSIVLSVVVFAFYLFFLGSHPLLNPDEARYSEVAREMLANHSLWVPLLNGLPFFDKPVLFYWLQILAMDAFGINEWALRLWPACLGVFGCVVTYGVGRVLYDRLTGVISGLILGSSLFYFLMSHYANLDLAVAVMLTAAIGLFLMGVQYEKSRRRSALILAAYVFAGLAVLTKGLIGLAFPMMIIGVWIMATGQWRLLRNMHMVSGLAIILAINLPWLIVTQHQHPEFLHYYFYIQQYSRYISGSFNDQEPLWFYLPVIIAGMVPWSLFLIQAISQKIKAVRTGGMLHSNELFLLLWPLLIFVFFSIPKSKTLGYILPVFPPLAIMVGHYCRQIWYAEKQQVWLFRGVSVLGLALWFALLIYVPKMPAAMQPSLFIISALFGLTGVALWMCQGLAFRYSAIVLLVAFAAIMTSVMGGIKTLHITAMPRLLPIIKLYDSPGTEVVEYERFDRDLPFYLQKPVTVVSDWNNPKLLTKDSWKGIFAYENHYQQASNLWTEDAFWAQWHAGKPMIIILKESKLKGFKQLAGDSALVVGNAHGKLVVINQGMLARHS